MRHYYLLLLPFCCCKPTAKAPARAAAPPPRARLPLSLSNEQRHHLRCYVKSELLLDTGVPRWCCFPPEAKNGSCAVVSNSGALMLGQYGEEIDQHPFVLRLNDGEVDGYEKFVGAKRSLRFGWNSTYHPKESYLECTSTRPVPTWSNVRLIECDQKHLTGMLHNLSGGVGGGAIDKATTGARALVMAMSNCAEVHAYGFFQITSSERRKLKFHYYGSGAKKPYEANNGVHTTWGAEHDLWPQLAEPGPAMGELRKMVIPGLPRITDCSPDSSATVPTYLVRSSGGGGGAFAAPGGARTASTKAPSPAGKKAPTTTTTLKTGAGSARQQGRGKRKKLLAGISRNGWASGFVAGAMSVTCVAMVVVCHRRYLQGESSRGACMIGLFAGAAVTITLSFLSQQELTVFSEDIAV